MKLVPVDSREAERIDTTVQPEIGQWYWLDVERDDKTVHKVLVCITHVGSNYVKVTGPDTTSNYYEEGTSSWRIHVDNFDEELTPEPDPYSHIEARIAEHKAKSRELIGEVKRLTAALGLASTRAKLGASASVAETHTSLAVASGTENIHAHKAALIKAKEETLPELFKQVEEQHKWLAKWMKARTIPERARLTEQKEVMERIDGQIFTVELYAGLIEQLTCIRDGAPATLDDKLHIFQRRHYMDEECLVNYTAGGMKFANVGAFDAWIAQVENRDRVLPHPRSIVAFKVRRNRREFDYDEFDGAPDISDFIEFWNEEKLDALTFLYLRNGEQVWRLSTKIAFDERLFPDQEHAELLGGGQLYWRRSGFGDKGILTEREYLELMAEGQRKCDEHAEELRVWKKRPKKSRGPKPRFWLDSNYEKCNYTKVNQDTVYYDDAMEVLAKMIREHNQIAVLLQGILDRSVALHPHPPWRLWTPEGFTSGIVLVYDDTRALTPGEKPDFEAYRMRLNQSLQRGSMTVGQEDLWLRHEAVKENDRRNRNWRRRDVSQLKRFHPDGNPGPGLIAKVVRLSRDGTCHYEWSRELRGYEWRPIKERPGYQRWTQKEGERRVTFHCPMTKVLNVSAYQPGDFKQFYNDPRTRAEYMKWAPLLLAAEDYVNGKKQGENMREPEPEPEPEESES